MKTIILLSALLLALTITPSHAQSLDFSSPSLFSSFSSDSSPSSLTGNNNSSNDIYTLSSLALLAWGIDYTFRSHSSSPPATTSTAPEINSIVIFSVLIVAFILYSLLLSLSLFSFPSFECLRWKKYQKGLNNEHKRN